MATDKTGEWEQTFEHVTIYLNGKVVTKITGAGEDKVQIMNGLTEELMATLPKNGEVACSDTLKRGDHDIVINGRAVSGTLGID